MSTYDQRILPSDRYGAIVAVAICAVIAVAFIAASAVGVARANAGVDADCPQRPPDALRGTPGWEVVFFVPKSAPGGIAEYARMVADSVENDIYTAPDFAVTYREGASEGEP